MRTAMTASFLIIGNEILSGRTVEKNLPVLAKLLRCQGVQLAEVRIVCDRKEDIIEAVCALKKDYDYVFTSGGIGPTHDDITSESIAIAVGQSLIENEQAIKNLESFYKMRQQSLTPTRRRMTRMPASAVIVNSDYLGTPAYQVENIFVCAGVPSIFKQMATAAVGLLPQGQVRDSLSLKVHDGESKFAEALAVLDQKYAEVEIGSYPSEPESGKYICEIVFSGETKNLLVTARDEFIEYLQQEKFIFEKNE